MDLVTSEQLVELERRFGGYAEKIQKSVVSALNPEDRKRLRQRGGDRMGAEHHGYGPCYAAYLGWFADAIGKRLPATVAEVGILQGNGLAMWCELFPAGTAVHGFDLDPGNYERNLRRLRANGAFAHNKPVVRRMDQFDVAANRKLLKTAAPRGGYELVIDDAFHSDAAIMATLEAFAPHLAPDFLYIVEDNDTAHALIRAKYPDWHVVDHGRLTVVSNLPIDGVDLEGVEMPCR